MEKEEKIAEQERLAEEMSFYGRLRRAYPLFAIFYVSCLRMIIYFAFSVRSHGSTFIFAT